MIKKYQNGSFGGLNGGVFGNTAMGTSGDSGEPFNFEKVITPLFIGAEYFNTINSTDKQLKGTLNTLHSLVPPGHAPEMPYQTPNYNLIEQQYEDAAAQLNSTPILGSSVDRQIAQQQAIGQQGVALNKQRIQNIGEMIDADRKEKMNIDYRNASQRYQETEAGRQHENTIKTSVQDEKDKALAIKKDALTKVLGESNQLWQLKQARQKERRLADMRLGYDKGLQSELDREKDVYDTVLAQEFRDQFDEDKRLMQDIEDFKDKYGIDLETWENNYDSDEYKTALDAYVKTKEADWTKRANDLTTAYYEDWLKKWGDEYYSLLKKGGKVKVEKTTSPRKSLSAEERIMIENTKNLHNFVKQMNDKQTKIFLKLMSL